MKKIIFILLLLMSTGHCQLLTKTYILSDTGTFNNTTGFGLAGGKTGSALKVKGLIESTNITITASGDSAYAIASSGGGSGSEDSVYFNTDSTGIGTEYENISNLLKIRPTSSVSITWEDSTTFDMLRFSVTEAWLDLVIDSSDIDHLSDYLLLAGGQMTGNITFSSTQTVDGIDLSTIPSVYETITEVGKIGDDTTNFKLAHGWGDHSTQNYLDDDVVGDVDALDIATGAVADDEIDYANVTLADFDYQTAFRVFYSNTAGDVTELALGGDGTYLRSNGASANPSFSTPSGSGDVTKVGTPVNDQIGVWTGDGTIEGDADLTFDGSHLTTTGNIIVSGTVDDRDISTLGDSLSTDTLTLKNVKFVPTDSGVQILIVDTIFALRADDDTLFVEGNKSVFKFDGAVIVNDGSGSYINADSGHFNTIIVLGDTTGTGYRLPLIDGTANQGLSTDGAGVIGWADYLLTAGTDNIKDSHIDWGAGANQVNLADVPGGTAGANAFDFGGATSLEIPNGVNPTTDAEGEMAYDTDDDALEIFDGSRSVLVPTKYLIQYSLWDPETFTDTICIWEADSATVQNGIVIENMSVLTSVDGTYELKFFSFTSADPPVFHDHIDTLNVGASDQFVSSILFQDTDAQTIDVGQRIYMLTPSTDIDWIKVKIRYYIKDNN